MVTPLLRDTLLRARLVLLVQREVQQETFQLSNKPRR
jgi:hypothetical protein